MPAFQVCARCSTRWPVGTRPAVWCPRCHGVLLSPVSTQAPAQGRRNFTWVARKPKSKAGRVRVPSLPRRTATPRYDDIPRWGLVDSPMPRPDERPTRVERWAGSAPGLLTLTGILLVLASVAELVRYGVLLYNRTRLVDPTVLVASDALVLFAEVASIVVGVGAAVGSACWLVTRRRAHFARAGSRDPRSARSIVIGCLVPVMSLAMPGVYLTELVRVRGRTDEHDLSVSVRIWWAAWIANWVLVLGAVLWRFRDSLQAQADGVLFSAFVAAVAAAVAFLTLRVIRQVDGRSLLGTDRPAPTRWVVAVGRTADNRTTADVAANSVAS